MFPYASTNRPGVSRSPSTAARACSGVCRPWDQSTVVVTPASSASQALIAFPTRMSCGRKRRPCSR